ncbi:MAG: EamA family transporter [Patescibacteria group bacterium]
MNLLTIIAAVAAFVGWGVGSFLAKIAADKIGTKSVFWDLLGYFPAIIIYSVFVFKFSAIVSSFQNNRLAVLLALSAGAVGSVGAVGFYYLISRSNASIIVPLTALYPALTVLLSVFFLHEKLSSAQISGVILAVISIFLLSK